MKPSGAPEIGDLVISKEKWRNEFLAPGIILETRGVECLVLWNGPDFSQQWWPRSRLEVINESR